MQAATETTIVSGDGTRLAARCSGTGSPIVLVHGALADLNGFALIEEQLAERHTVWVYSRRGRGGSGDGKDYGLEREVEDVLAVLEAAGSPAHLLGHSSGAYYCLLAAPRAPSLKSLVLYEPPLHASEVDPSLLEKLVSAVDAGEPDRALEDFMPVAGIPEDEIAAIRAQEPIWAALREGVLVFPRELRALQVEGRRMLSTAKRPDVPVLYLYGELTVARAYPAVDEVAELLPGARVHCLKGQRHLAPIFDPAAFAHAVLEFTIAHNG